MEQPKLGQLITEPNPRRDAVHVAVYPAVAGEFLLPGWRIRMEDGEAFSISTRADGAVGIVDPFLEKGVEKGQRFWLCLYPDTVTSLRHVWTHPAFTVRVPEETK